MNRPPSRPGAACSRRNADLVAGADRIEALPPIGLPEIAFAGRSNVGKSSLVNALTGRTTLARVSHNAGTDAAAELLRSRRPPRSRGYARLRLCPRGQEQDQGLERSDRALSARRRPSLRRVCLLVDARARRHGRRPCVHGAAGRGGRFVPGRAHQVRQGEAGRSSKSGSPRSAPSWRSTSPPTPTSSSPARTTAPASRSCGRHWRRWQRRANSTRLRPPPTT